jgi:hypothetical protein
MYFFFDCCMHLKNNKKSKKNFYYNFIKSINNVIEILLKMDFFYVVRQRKLNPFIVTRFENENRFKKSLFFFFFL